MPLTDSEQQPARRAIARFLTGPAMVEAVASIGELVWNDQTALLKLKGMEPLYDQRFIVVRASHHSRPKHWKTGPDQPDAVTLIMDPEGVIHSVSRVKYGQFHDGADPLERLGTVMQLAVTAADCGWREGP